MNERKRATRTRNPLTKMGGKIFDKRKIVGGEVRTLNPERNFYVFSLDFNSMYPSQQESCNIATSTRVDRRIIEHPEKFGLEIIRKRTVLDCFGRRSFYWLRHTTDEQKSKIYRVEQFFCEYTIEADKIKKKITKINGFADNIEDEPETIAAKILKAKRKIKEIWPESKILINDKPETIDENGNEITENSVPNTVIKSNYFAQSHKRPDGWTDEHISLFEIMLTDLRFKRNATKKEMNNAKDEMEKQRFNSKQLAIKIVSNSVYGASGSNFFAYYDNDIGATITYSSRQMIRNLSNILEAKRLLVTAEFIEKNKNLIENLQKFGIISFSDYGQPLNGETLNDAQRQSVRDEKPQTAANDNREQLNDKTAEPLPIPKTLREIYNEYLEPIKPGILMEIYPSKIVYQDTDSNYYTNEKIANITGGAVDPAAIVQIMDLMMAHNKLIENFVALSVFRPPIGVSFDGAKIVARYFRVKKKYFGIEWDSHMRDKLDEKAYLNGKLIENYDEYWRPGISVLPRSDGSYIEINPEELLEKRVDFVTYVHGQNITVKGMNIARRDSPRCINYLNLEVYKHDLILSRYISGNWVNISKGSLSDVINTVLDMFKQQINRIEEIKEHILNDFDESYALPVPFFRLVDYSKQVTYKSDKKNPTMLEILKHFDKKGRPYPEHTERLNYVYIITKKIRKQLESGKSVLSNIGESARVLEELSEKFERKYPKAAYKNLKYYKRLPYKIFIEILIISSLNFRFYVSALCSSLSVFACEYLQKELLDSSMLPQIDDKKRGEMIKRAQQNAAKILLERFYRIGKKQAFNEIDERKKNTIKRNLEKNNTAEKLLKMCYEIFPTHTEGTSYRQYGKMLKKYKEILENNINKFHLAFKILNNSFNRFTTDDEETLNIVKTLQEDEEAKNILKKQYTEIFKKLQSVEYILSKI